MGREMRKRVKADKESEIYFILGLNLPREWSDVVHTHMICNLI